MKIVIKPLGPVACFWDFVFDPVMRIMCGTWYENPQRTHRWNNYHLRTENVAHLSREMMVCHDGLPGETSVYPLFHLPVFGGWRNYVVAMPVEKQQEWYIGWIAGSFAGVSRIPIAVMARVLVGPGSVCWFGINANGDQIPIQKIGVGCIGEGGVFAQITLL